MILLELLWNYPETVTTLELHSNCTEKPLEVEAALQLPWNSARIGPIFN